ncbi:MAG TPA: DUF1579 domain-containing protein [Thermoanaerobaculia bacterium]|nr:DUF1579 domain-containing protein [Thermoanaerobaculia bacterium]
MTTTETSEPHPGMTKPEPQKEHQWLARLVGDWSMEGEANMGPGTPETFKGTESARSIGGLWVIVEGEGAMPGGGTSTSMMTLGYDPQKKRFVGSFLGSMMTNLWIYEGTLDADGRVLTLDTEGPGMSGDGTLAKYKDSIEFKSDDERVMTSQVQGADGTWTQIMTMTSRRKK